jgi:transposase
MKRFVEGMDRSQSTLFPECLDDLIDENSPVRAIDAFVEAAISVVSGLRGRPAETGRPAYHPESAATPAALRRYFSRDYCCARWNARSHAASALEYKYLLVRTCQASGALASPVVPLL